MSKHTKRTSRSTRSGSKSTARAAVLRTVLLGAPVELVYRHARGGTYRHKFGRGARVSVSHDGRFLIVDGVRVKQFIEG